MKKLKFIISLIGTMIFSGCNFYEEQKALKTLKQLDDGLYFIEYIGDYDFDAFLAQGGNKTNDEMADFLTKSLSKGKWTDSTNPDEKSTVKITTPNFGCSSIVAKNQNGETICGRNYDWKDCSVMIIHTKPNNGYESISTCCLEFLGYDRNWVPSYKFPNDMMALTTIYVPLDGMNEKGLYIADLVNGDNETTAQNRGKTPLTITTAIRLILDKAATVDEAIELLDSVDIHSVIDTAHHFAIADASGKSVVVEWVDNKMYVTETKVVTNHYTAESPKQGVCTYENSKERFSQLEKTGTEHNWIMNAEQVKEALKSVRAGQYEFSTHELTVWSSVYEPKERRITYYLRENYEKPIIIEF